jgi:hypothetical protein
VLFSVIFEYLPEVPVAEMKASNTSCVTKGTGSSLTYCLISDAIVGTSTLEKLIFSPAKCQHSYLNKLTFVNLLFDLIHLRFVPRNTENPFFSQT